MEIALPIVAAWPLHSEAAFGGAYTIRAVYKIIQVLRVYMCVYIYIYISMYIYI